MTNQSQDIAEKIWQQKLLLLRPRLVDVSFIVTCSHQKIKALFSRINFDYAKNFVEKCFVFLSILLLLSIKIEKKNTQ